MKALSLITLYALLHVAILLPVFVLITLDYSKSLISPKELSEEEEFMQDLLQQGVG
ncbi:MAG TPA: hypothetical protein VF610_07395 [Segetibacter sp.]|jgi:hypothetical protein